MATVAGWLLGAIEFLVFFGVMFLGGAKLHENALKEHEADRLRMAEQKRKQKEAKKKPVEPVVESAPVEENTTNGHVTVELESW